MIPDKTGHPLYTTSPDCNGLFTAFVWPGLVFFRATGKNQSFEVGSGQNQSEPDAEKQTCDRLVRPDFMYQTNMRKSLVHGFGTDSHRPLLISYRFSHAGDYCQLLQHWGPRHNTPHQPTWNRLTKLLHTVEQPSSKRGSKCILPMRTAAERGPSTMPD